jgi:protoporphyrinogen oxidase
VSQVLILGAGVTGLAAGWVSGFPVYEAQDAPGGICSSYYVRPGRKDRLPDPPRDGEAYRFEIGGGHWIFGGDPLVLRFIRSLSPIRTYERRSGVFFPDQKLIVPYPLQHHLGYLGRDVSTKALVEMLTGPKKNPRTMSDWLESSFGPTLTELFFGPFHELYTAGLWRRIAPQDPYKSPVSPQLAIQGGFDRTPPVGYNVTFVYPIEGLNALARAMAGHCRIHYGKRAMKIDVKTKEVFFEDGTSVGYETLISTLPLNKVLEMTGLVVEEPADPFTSVLVLNIGAERRSYCPQEHWLYVPRSKAGFHRVGFYSNVDVSFLPWSSRESNDRVGIYVERAYPGGQQPNDAEVDKYAEDVVAELQSWGWIGDVEVADATWIEVAYTWSWPGSGWRQRALLMLEKHGVWQVGRFARWIFQGIADSLAAGFLAGATLRVGPHAN